MAQRSPAKKSLQSHLLAVTLGVGGDIVVPAIAGRCHDRSRLHRYRCFDRFDPGCCSQLFLGMIARAPMSLRTSAEARR